MREMQVDRGLFEIAVSQQHLDGAQVGSGFEQMVAKQCRRVWGWMCLCSRPARSAACLQANQTTLVSMGRLAVCPHPPGNNQVDGLCLSPRQYSRSASSSFGLSRTSRSLRPLPPRI
jgi:hypothetical protein